MAQVVRTYFGQYPQAQIEADMSANPSWQIRTMASMPDSQLIVVYDDVRPMKHFTDSVMQYEDGVGWRKKGAEAQCKEADV